MSKIRVLTVVGTRPEIIRLSRVMAELNDNCNHILVHTGQNYDYELNQVFFEDLGVKKPDYFLESANGSTNAATTIANIISAIDKVLAEVMPDAMLVLGDTNSCLSVLPAKRRKIPIFHMEAGNRCFDQRVPEELNRRLVDHTADINLTYSTIAREYLLREGLPPDQIIKTGSPMKEVLSHYHDKINSSNILGRIGLHPKEYFLVSVHREENVESIAQFSKFVELLNNLAHHFQLPVVVSTHPRTRKSIEENKVKFDGLVNLMKPLGFFDYVQLQLHAKAVLSDSGTINEESSILGFPALNLREAHERPEGMEEAAVMMTGLNVKRIHQCLSMLMKESTVIKGNMRMVADYNVDNVSKKVVRIIHSYIDYINRVTWKKY